MHHPSPKSRYPRLRASSPRIRPDESGRHSLATTDFSMPPMQIAQISLIMPAPNEPAGLPWPTVAGYHERATIRLKIGVMSRCRKPAPDTRPYVDTLFL